MIAFFDGELINDQKFIISGIVKVDQAGGSPCVLPSLLTSILIPSVNRR